MSFISGTLSVKCKKCGTVTDFDSDEADFEPTGGGDDRGMGQENGYNWETTFNCDKCGNEIEIDYEVWEYPVGAFNNDDVRLSGATEEGRYSYDFQDEPEPDDFE